MMCVYILFFVVRGLLCVCVCMYTCVYILCRTMSPPPSGQSRPPSLLWALVPLWLLLCYLYFEDPVDYYVFVVLTIVPLLFTNSPEAAMAVPVVIYGLHAFFHLLLKFDHSAAKFFVSCGIVFIAMMSVQ